MSLDTGLKPLHSQLDSTAAEKDVQSEVPDQRVMEADDAARHKAEVALRHLEGLADFYKLRRKWSWFIMGSIFALITFHMVLTTLVGLNVLDYHKYPWFLTVVVTEHLIQIVALAVIVVKFLFSDSLRNSSEQ